VKWGQLKTDFFSELIGDAKEQFDQYDFGQFIDDAQLSLIAQLPAKMIPECVEAVHPERYGNDEKLYGAAAAYIVDGVQVFSVEIETEDYDAEERTAPIYRSMRWADPQVFMATQKRYSDLMWTQIGDTILLNAVPSETWGDLPSLRIMQKKRPASYITTAGGTNYSFFGWATTSVPNNNLLPTQVAIVGTAGGSDFQRSSDVGLSFFNGLYDGGIAIVTSAVSGMSYVRNDGMIAPVASVEDKAVSGEYGVAAVVTLEAGYDIPEELPASLLITIQPPSSGDTPAVQSDILSPTIADRWHRIMLDMALASAWLRLGVGDKHELYTKRVDAYMQKLGIARTERT